MNRESKKSFIKGTIWNSLGSTMYGVNSFIMLLVVSSNVDATEVGYFGIAFTTAQLMYIVGLLGTNHYQQTDYHEKYSLGDYKKAKLFACILMIIGSSAVIFFMNFTGVKILYTYLLTVLMLVNAVADMYQNVFFQKNRLDLSGGALFYRTLWSLVAFVLTATVSKSIICAIIIQVVVNIAVTMYYVKRYVPIIASEFSNNGKSAAFKNQSTENQSIDRNDGKDIKSEKKYWKLIIECLPLFVSLFLMNVLLNASKYGIEFLMDDETQGYYNMVFIPLQVINLFSQFIFKPLFNKYSRIIEERKYSLLYKLIVSQVLGVAVFAILCAIVANICGISILGMLYGKDVSAYKQTLLYVIYGGGIFAITQLFYYVMVILREQIKIMIIYVIGTTVASISAVFLIIKDGINGAALSLIVTISVVLVLYIVTFVSVVENRRRYEKDN